MIDAAIRAARRSDFDRYRHGAALWYKGKLVATGSNARLARGKSIHAEERVLAKIPKHADRRHLTLVVARINRQGSPRLSRPCDGCWRVIERAGLAPGQVVWTVNDAQNHDQS